jgi:type II secretory pathway pseudopilin PulG
MTLMEIMIAISILSVVLAASLSFMLSTTRASSENMDRAFAIQKANAMIAELRAVGDRTTTGELSVLDTYDDGTGTSVILTTDPTVDDAAHILSGNRMEGDRWKYSRRVTVRKFPNYESRDLRIVTVKVFRTLAGVSDATLLAEVTSVVNAVGNSYPPTQVYDVYLLSLENIPGWWVYMAYIKPFIENTLADMEARHPGLSFRTHWITKSSYGRDRQYRPYLNNASDSNADINSVYFYPGTMPTGSACNFYYVPTLFNACVNIDNVTTNGYNATTNPLPYALADNFNNSMRFPEELATYNTRLAAGCEDSGVLTYRLLLDDMIANPANYRNAIFINLHGELVPMPPVRNYSDAAKDPLTYPGWRVVTHPQKLRSPLAENVVLRVYGYLTDPAVAGNNFTTVPVTVTVPGANLTTAGDLAVTAIRGGTDQEPGDGVADTYAAVTPAPTTVGAGTTLNRMYYTVTYDALNDRSIIRLFNTPLKCTGTTTGLATANRLYGMEYIPTTCEATNTFATNLVTATVVPKNTARWIITIPVAALNREFGNTASLLTFDTRIGDNLDTGQMWPVSVAPSNLSRTYVYRNDNANAVPFSERYQFLGDPRHMPYSDVKAAFGYNWYFDHMRDGTASALASWPGFDATRIRNGAAAADANIDGWHGGAGTGDSMEIDVPRFFQMLRTALTESNTVYTTLTGWSYYYMGLGGEIGYDAANGFANSIPVSTKPFTGVSGTRNEQSIITDLTGGVKYVREAVTNYWWSKSWLGELYPDSAVAQWNANGNLPTGNVAGRFVQIRRQDIRTSGTAPIAPAASFPTRTNFGYPTVRRTNAYGCTSFFNMGTTASTFRHTGRDGTTGSLGAAGTEMAANYNFPLPQTTNISRPWRCDNNWGAVPNEFSIADYVALRSTYSQPATFYGHQDGAAWYGSGVVRLQNSAGNSTFIVVSGVDRTVESGSAFIARLSTLALVQTFFTAGLPATPSRIVQLPRLTITVPNDTTEIKEPTDITVTWSTQWRRWDGLKYTTGYADTFTEDDSQLRYALLYSTDNGQTWLHVADNSAATPGIPNTGLLVDDAVTGGNESYAWNVSDEVRFPEGSYLLRVEAYRRTIVLHYSEHTRMIFIDR